MHTEAHVSLCRLGGVNYRQPITRRGHSVIVADPHRPDRTYRLDAALFDAGKGQVRGSWYIQPWTPRAVEITESERDWQT